MSDEMEDLPDLEGFENMQDQLLELVTALEEEEGMNLMEDYPLFKWSYDARPDIEFQLLIKQLDADEIPMTNTTIH